MLGEPTDRPILEGDTSVRPVEVEVAPPSSTLAVKAEQAAELGILRRHPPGAVSSEDPTVGGDRDRFLLQGAVRICGRGIVDRDEEMESARSGLARDLVGAFRNALIPAPTLGPDRLSRERDRKEPDSTSFTRRLQHALSLANLEARDRRTRQASGVGRRDRSRRRFRPPNHIGGRVFPGG